MLVDTASIWTAVVVGLLIFVLFLRTRLHYAAFPELKPGAETRTDDLDVTVIIPARNEERLIAACIESLPKGVRVIVMNDNSKDATARVAVEAGAEVIQAPALRSPNLGKSSACYAAYSLVTTKYMLFVDADTRFKPEFLPTLIGHATANSLDMVSLFLKRKHPNLLSALFMPYAYALHFAGVNVKGVHSLHLFEAHKAIASGQCILFSAAAYEFTGGHRKMLNEVLDDIEIAMLAKRHRLKFQIMRAEKLGVGRMYESSMDTWRAFQKSIIKLLSYNQVAAAVSVFTGLMPFAYVPILLWLWTDIDEDYARQTMWAFAVVPFLPLLAWYRSPLWLLSPLLSHLFPIFVLDALARWLLGTKTTWKGRKV